MPKTKPIVEQKKEKILRITLVKKPNRVFKAPQSHRPSPWFAPDEPDRGAGRPTHPVGNDRLCPPPG